MDLNSKIKETENLLSSKVSLDYNYFILPGLIWDDILRVLTIFGINTSEKKFDLIKENICFGNLSSFAKSLSRMKSIAAEQPFLRVGNISGTIPLSLKKLEISKTTFFKESKRFSLFLLNIILLKISHNFFILEKEKIDKRTPFRIPGEDFNLFWLKNNIQFLFRSHPLDIDYDKTYDTLPYKFLIGSPPFSKDFFFNHPICTCFSYDISFPLRGGFIFHLLYHSPEEQGRVVSNSELNTNKIHYDWQSVDFTFNKEGELISIDNNSDFFDEYNLDNLYDIFRFSILEASPPYEPSLKQEEINRSPLNTNKIFTADKNLIFQQIMSLSKLELEELKDYIEIRIKYLK